MSFIIKHHKQNLFLSSFTAGIGQTPTYTTDISRALPFKDSQTALFFYHKNNVQFEYGVYDKSTLKYVIHSYG